MGQVLRVLEGPIAPMICAKEGEMTEICGFLDSCRIQLLWSKVRDAVARTIDAMTLAELVGTPDQVQDAPSQFIALSDIRVANSATN
jgi:DNA-binding IscR family transcriptional regulator